MASAVDSREMWAREVKRIYARRMKISGSSREWSIEAFAEFLDFLRGVRDDPRLGFDSSLSALAGPDRLPGASALRCLYDAIGACRAPLRPEFVKTLFNGQGSSDFGVTVSGLGSLLLPETPMALAMVGMLRFAIPAFSEPFVAYPICVRGQVTGLVAIPAREEEREEDLEDPGPISNRESISLEWASRWFIESLRGKGLVTSRTPVLVFLRARSITGQPEWYCSCLDEFMRHGRDRLSPADLVLLRDQMWEPVPGAGRDPGTKSIDPRLALPIGHLGHELLAAQREILSLPTDPIRVEGPQEIHPFAREAKGDLGLLIHCTRVEFRDEFDESAIEGQEADEPLAKARRLLLRKVRQGGRAPIRSRAVRHRDGSAMLVPLLPPPERAPAWGRGLLEICFWEPLEWVEHHVDRLSHQAFLALSRRERLPGPEVSSGLAAIRPGDESSPSLPPTYLFGRAAGGVGHTLLRFSGLRAPALILEGEEGAEHRLLGQLLHRFRYDSCKEIRQCSEVSPDRMRADPAGVVEAVPAGTLIISDIERLLDHPASEQALLQRSRRGDLLIVLSTIRSEGDPGVIERIEATRVPSQPPGFWLQAARYHVRIPALRERGRDVLSMAEELFSGTRYKSYRDRLSEKFRWALQAYGWPKNLAELRQLITEPKQPPTKWRDLPEPLGEAELAQLFFETFTASGERLPRPKAIASEFGDQFALRVIQAGLDLVLEGGGEDTWDQRSNRHFGVSWKCLRSNIHDLAGDRYELPRARDLRTIDL